MKQRFAGNGLSRTTMIFKIALIDDHNCRIFVPNEYQKHFVPLTEK